MPAVHVPERFNAAVHLHNDLVHAAVLVGHGVSGIGPDDPVLSVAKLHFAFGLEFVDVLPKTSTGKIHRFHVRAAR